MGYKLNQNEPAMSYFKFSKETPLKCTETHDFFKLALYFYARKVGKVRTRKFQRTIESLSYSL